MHFRTHKNKPVKNFGSFDSFKFDERERKNNAVNHQKTAYGKGFGVPEVIRTPDLSLRRRSLYPAELRKRMQQLFSFEPSQDSNDLPLRRRSLYPAELRKHIAIVWFLKKDSYNLRTANLRTAIIKIKATVSRKRETVFYVKIKYEAGKRCSFKPSSPSMRNQTG